MEETNVNTCLSCGKETEIESSYCNDCCAELINNVKYTDINDKKSIENKSFKLVLSGICILALVLIVFFVGRTDHSSPKAVVRAYFDAMESGNTSKLMSTIDPEVMTPITEGFITKNQLEKMMKDNMIQYQIEMKKYLDVEYIIGEQTIYKDTGIVKVTCKTQKTMQDDIEIESIEIFTTRVNNKWYIDLIRFFMINGNMR